MKHEFINIILRNQHRLMSLDDFPRSPYLDAYAVLGHCCSYAAYCPFYMFKGLDARGCGVVVVGGGGEERERGKGTGRGRKALKLPN